jgi:membrane protease subunit HflC
MENNKFTLIAILGLLLTAMSSLYIVDQRQYAIVFQFGEAVKTVDEPGLNFRIPLIQNVVYFDKRLLNVKFFDTKELTTVEGKRFLMDAFARFKISDPVVFYKTVFNMDNAQIRLNRILESSARKVIGQYTLPSLLNTDRNNIMDKITELVKDEAKIYGVSVVDVRIVRVDLPSENSNAIYQRMTQERAKEAKQIRAEGEEEAQRIRALADKQKVIILAESYKKAEELRGNGDKIAIQLFNDAFSYDPEFFKLYKTLATYKQIFNENNTNYILSSKSELFRYLDIKAKEKEK